MSHALLGLADPDRWTTADLRGSCDLKGMRKPDGVTDADAYTIVQPPGSVVWNAVTTPHWVETFDEAAVTLTLVHDGLRLDGRLCPHAEEAAQWRAARGKLKRKPEEWPCRSRS